MRLLRIIGMGLRGLASKPARTALSALGIVIGVAAVVALTSLGNGVRESVSGQITDLGPNLITVSPGSEEGDDGGIIDAEMASTLTLGDARSVAALPSVKAASAVVATRVLVEGEGVAFMGVDPSYDEVRRVALASGRFVAGEGELVLSQADAQRLFGGTPGEVVGKRVSISGSAQNFAAWLPENAFGVPMLSAQNAPQEPAGRPANRYEVVGVLASQPEGGFLQAAADVSYMTTEDALALSRLSAVGQILVSASSADAVDQAKANITSQIRSNHRGQADFTVETQEDLLSTFSQITDQLNIFLAGIAGISLLVGGIGIMNIMLVSVAERTREIGVRKALGATDADILSQFLFEAVLLAALGGLAGVALGVGAPSLLPLVLPTLPAPVFSAAQIALAFGVSALIGVLFGSLPAYRSARLAPVEALRRE